MELLVLTKKYGLTAVSLLSSVAGPLLIVFQPLDGLSMNNGGLGTHKLPAPYDPTVPILQRLIDLKRQVEQNSVRRTLQECLQIGIQQNMQLSAGYASIQQQEYTLTGVRRQYLPTLSMTSLPPFLGAVKTQSSATQFQQVILNPNGTTQVVYNPVSSSSKQNYNQLAPYLTLTWSFFQPSLLASINAQKAQLQRQRLAFDVTARSAVLSIQQAYFQLQASKSLIDSFEKIYRINLEQVDFVENRQKAGLTNIGSVAQAKSQLYSQMNQLIAYYESYLQSAANLALAMNEPSDKIIIPADYLQATGSWSDSLQDTVNQALSLREEIKIYLESEAALTWNARASIRQYLPTLMLQGFYYGIFNKGVADALVNYETGYTFKAVGLGITWNIFDGGVAAAESEALMANSRNSRYLADYERYQVREQIKKTYASYQTSILSLQNAKANLDAANMSIEVNQARFGVGLTEVTSLVQSMQLLGQASEAYSNSILQYNNSVAELYRYSSKWPDNIESVLAKKVNMMKLDN
jgi:outer membrane protein TolC